MYQTYVGNFIKKDKFAIEYIIPPRPSIIWIEHEHKKQFIYNDIEDFKRLKILSSRREYKIKIPLPVSSSINYKQITFIHKPTQDLIRTSLENHNNKNNRKEELIIMALNFLYYIREIPINKELQQYWLNGFYATLANLGLLHILFDNQIELLSKKIYLYLKRTHIEEQNILNVCSYIGISKATLIRKLNKENKKFKDILKKVRMEKAMSLIKSGIYDLDDIAINSGYQSYKLFKRYFEEEFKASPEEIIYIYSVMANNTVTLVTE